MVTTIAEKNLYFYNLREFAIRRQESRDIVKSIRKAAMPCGIEQMARRRKQDPDCWPSEDPKDTLERGRFAAGALVQSMSSDERASFARGFCFRILATYWHGLQAGLATMWDLPEAHVLFERAELSPTASRLAEELGTTATAMEPVEAAYLIGRIYTSMLPPDVRSTFGVYYTPPALTEQLLDMASEAGIDWADSRILDPACGGGAFLTPVAQRIMSALDGRDADIVVHAIGTRLQGFEIDPFSAWSSQVFLEGALMDLCRCAGQRLPRVVKVCDSLDEMPSDGRFDLIVGNPPYGRVRLSAERRDRFRRSLFGHANLYGLFTDLALRFCKAGGMIAYVTPTSFLAGEYFKSLRAVLGREAPPAEIDFLALRKGIFDDVLQETLLAVYRHGAETQTGKVKFAEIDEHRRLVLRSAGSFTLPEEPSRPWILPREDTDEELVRRMRGMPHRLADYGYAVSTGPLVWNRHKPQLKAAPGPGRYPLIWAEAVSADGRFTFRAERRNHASYFKPELGQDWLITREPCVLLQRTTAKEQARRLIAAELPRDFLSQSGAVVVENHLNMIRLANGAALISAKALAALLNSEITDRAFRCINGSVAVSAYELEALPLPDPTHIDELEGLVRAGVQPAEIDRAVARMYLGEER